MRTLIRIEEERAGIAPRGFKRVIKKAMKMALACENVKVHCEISVLITDDDGIHRINKEFRDVDRPTDVLSFPMQDLRPGAFSPEMCVTDPSSGRVILGDMAVSADRIKAQAEEFGHSLNRELSYLTVHSCLHLLGYDHVDEGDDKRLMREHEEIVMALLKIK